MIIVKYRKLFFTITAVITVASLLSIALFGIKLGIDFTGGVLAEVHYQGAQPTVDSLTNALATAGIEGTSVRPFGDSAEGAFLVRTPPLTEEQRTQFPQIIAIEGATPSIASFTEVGPTLGSELRVKAFIALALVIIAIALYVAFVFRHVSRPVSSWIYGVITICALVHDVIIPAAALAIMGHFFGTQADALFITALLAILGFSVHDTIVTFDRVRENLRLNTARGIKETFETTVGKALNQTIVRSINTSMTTLIALTVLYILGPASTHDFTFIMIVGIIAGTYSSIFLAAPLLIAVERHQAGK